MSTKKKIIIIISLTLILVIGTLIGLFVYSMNAFSKSENIASNIIYEGVYIGDLTKEEALVLLKDHNFTIHNPVKVVYNDKSFEVAPSGAGLNYDYEKIVDNAFKIGRGGSFFKNMADVIKSRFKYIPVGIEYDYDSETFSETVNTLSMDSGIDFKNLEINVYENYARVKINRDLTNIDYNKLYTDMVTAIEAKDGRNVNLPTLKIDKVTPRMIYDRIFVNPQNASMEIIDGVTTVTPHTIGILVEMEDIEKALDEGKATFNVPVVKKYPEVRVENFNKDLFRDVLGTYTSKYNSAIKGRTQNVTLAANKINSVILNPGDVFSYNNIVGPRTSQRGFSVATVYTSSGLQEELGGGICQVSSTLYNAVLYADLKIVERKNHMYTVSYVKNGLDATVAYGLIDFKFENSLKSPIKVVTSVGGGVLTVTLLGKKENNNKVELYTNTLETYPFSEKEVFKSNMKPGERVVTQNGGLGYKINATKVVKDSSGNIIRQEFLGTNVYKPLTKIIEVGPKLEEVPAPDNPKGEEDASPGEPVAGETTPGEEPKPEDTKDIASSDETPSAEGLNNAEDTTNNGQNDMPVDSLTQTDNEESVSAEV